MADLFAVAFDPNKKEIRTSKTEGGGGDLAPGRAKSLAISPGRWGQIPATPEQIVCYIKISKTQDSLWQVSTVVI